MTFKPNAEQRAMIEEAQNIFRERARREKAGELKPVSQSLRDRMQAEAMSSPSSTPPRAPRRAGYSL